jgi:Haem-binding uptake, Tiki superfamily, ChaN
MLDSLMSRRPLLVLLLSLVAAGGLGGATGPPPADAAAGFLSRAAGPLDYILAKSREHRVVFLGEAHWIRHDPALVAALVPRLPEAGVTVLGIEMLRVGDQDRLDTLVSAPAWDPGSALAVLRHAEWPYREYLEILHAVWKANHGGSKLRVLALGPDGDWRRTLAPLGQNYDTFMADVVTRCLSGTGTRVVLYCGLNHAFTRFHQPELPRSNRVEAFFDRAGNILWRKFGEEVFLVDLHHPWRCRAGGHPSRCLPAGGAIDCAAERGGRAVGFDVPGSPFARSSLDGFEYALGYPDLRLEDLTDGIIWQKPLQKYRGVTLIPLAEFAPDAKALAEVSDHSPFADTKGAGREELEKQWREQQAWLRDCQETRGWKAAIPSCGD